MDWQIGGLSPQARGNRYAMMMRRYAKGPIPAGAGEPSQSRCLRWISMAYPRRRGGTKLKRLSEFDPEGLSPQARGNLIAKRIFAA